MREGPATANERSTELQLSARRMGGKDGIISGSDITVGVRETGGRPMRLSKGVCGWTGRLRMLTRVDGKSGDAVSTSGSIGSDSCDEEVK